MCHSTKSKQFTIDIWELVSLKLEQLLPRQARGPRLGLERQWCKWYTITWNLVHSKQHIVEYYPLINPFLFLTNAPVKSRCSGFLGNLSRIFLQASCNSSAMHVSRNLETTCKFAYVFICVTLRSLNYTFAALRQYSQIRFESLTKSKPKIGYSTRPHRQEGVYQTWHEICYETELWQSVNPLLYMNS